MYLRNIPYEMTTEIITGISINEKSFYLKCKRLLNTEPMNRISQVLTIKHGVGLERQHSQCGLLGGWATTVTPPKNPRFWPWDHAHRVQNGLTIGHCWASIHPTLSLYTHSQLCTRNQFYNKINASYSNTAHLYKYFIFKSSYLHNNLKHYYSQIYLWVCHLGKFSRRVWHY